MPVLEETTIRRASNEWWRRPEDERYLSLEDLFTATFNRKFLSRIATTSTAKLIARGSEEPRGALYLEHDELGILDPTHWSHRAACHALPYAWEVDAGDRVRPGRPSLRRPRGQSRPALSPQARTRADHAPGNWRATGQSSAASSAPTMAGSTTTRSSRRSCGSMTTADGTSLRPATKPRIPSAPPPSTRATATSSSSWSTSEPHRGPGRRHHPASSSAASWSGTPRWGTIRFGFMTFLYDHVCDNRTIWGAREVKELRIKHTKNAPERFEREVTPMLTAYAEASVVDVKEHLERAARKTVGSSDEDVLAFLRKHEFTKKEGEKVIEMAKVEEGGARSVWELVNGGTALARGIPHADERVRFEKRVSSLLRVA